MNEDIFTLKMNGYCCSQMVMELGLSSLGMENSQLVLSALLPETIEQRAQAESRDDDEA